MSRVEGIDYSGMDEDGNIVHYSGWVVGPDGAPSIVRPEARARESECKHCRSRIMWVASEIRWVSFSNDHSYCPVSTDHRHEPIGCYPFLVKREERICGVHGTPWPCQDRFS